jgi:hypothetical protein
MPQRERLQRQLLELSIITLITVVIWIGYEVYNTLTSPVDTNVSARELRVIPPPLKSEQFESLRDRLVIDEETLNNFSVSSGGLLQVTPTPVPVPATPSSQASPSASIL